MLITELIDTQWNVNLSPDRLNHIEDGELIDTQWNVNEDTNSSIRAVDNELIDTQWNVNLSRLRLSHLALWN